MFLGTLIYALYCRLIYFVKLKGFIKIILQHQMCFDTIVHTHISLSCSFLNSLRYTKAEQQEAIRTYSQWVKNIYRFVFEFWSTDFFYPANLIRKGQLISKCPFVVIVLTKIPTNFLFKGFLPWPLKRCQIKKSPWSNDF